MTPKRENKSTTIAVSPTFKSWLDQHRRTEEDTKRPKFYQETILEMFSITRLTDFIAYGVTRQEQKETRKTK